MIRYEEEKISMKTEDDVLLYFMGAVLLLHFIGALLERDFLQPTELFYNYEREKLQPWVMSPWLCLTHTVTLTIWINMMMWWITNNNKETGGLENKTGSFSICFLHLFYSFILKASLTEKQICSSLQKDCNNMLDNNFALILINEFLVFNKIQ